MFSGGDRDRDRARDDGLGAPLLLTATTPLQQLQQMEEAERLAVRKSRGMLLLACCVGQAGLMLSIGAAMWSHRYKVLPASISDMNADGPSAKIFSGTLLAMAIILLASKYGQRVLRLRSTAELLYFDVLIPVAILLTACVPEIFVPEEEGGPGAALMTMVHGFSAAVVFVASPVVLTAKAIPRSPPQQQQQQQPQQAQPPSGGGVSSGGWCCGSRSLCQPNPLLSSYGSSVLLRCGGRPVLRYYWPAMVVLQTVSLGLGIVFFTYNELYAALPREHEHTVSLATEFCLVTCLFVSYLIISRLGAEEEGRANGAAEAVMVRDSNGTGAPTERDEETGVSPGLNGQGGGHPQPHPQPQPQQRHGQENGHGEGQERPSANATAFAEWVRQFTSRVSIGE